MTTICAVLDANNRTTYIAADRRICIGGQFQELAVDQSKILRSAPLTIGVAGDLQAIQLLFDFLESQTFIDNVSESLLDKPSAHGYVRKLFAEYLKWAPEFGLRYEHENGPYDSLNANYLVATDDGELFTVYGYGEVLRHEDYAAIGSGRQYALGAVSALFGQLPDGKPVSKQHCAAIAVHAATFFDTSTCGVESHMIKWPELNLTKEG